MASSKCKKLKLASPEPILNVVPVIVDGDDEENFERLLEEIEKENLDQKKLAQIRILVEKLKEEMGKSQAIRPSMDYNTINKFLGPIIETLNATEIPDEEEKTVDDYIIQLEPPLDNEKYVKALENIRKQIRTRANSRVRITCPIEPDDCTTKCPDESNAKNHIHAHLKINLYQCRKCMDKFVQKSALITHIKGQHLNHKVQCHECGQEFNARSNLSRHQANGHVIPTGRKVFVVLGPGKIKLRTFQSEWIHVKYGGTHQLIVIPWVDENGIVVDWSVGFTRGSNIQRGVEKLWADIQRECNKDGLNESWVKACGSAKEEVRKGFKMSPELSFSLEIFAVGIIAISQVKWYARKYYDSVHILATKEAQFFLSEYNDILKKQLDSFMDKVPPRIKTHVTEYGKSFAM